MPGLTLAFDPKGLAVSGETYAVRGLLRHQGGRWDPGRSLWVLPFDGKQALLEALAGSPEGRGLAVHDGAKARLNLAPAENGVRVEGDTFPVKTLLKREGGVWNPTAKAWSFPHRGCAELAKALQASPDVATTKKLPVTGEEQGPATPPPVQRLAIADEKASAKKTITRGRLRGKQAPAEGRPGASGSQQLQPQRREALKVTEVGRTSSRAEQRVDGTQAKTQEEKKERRVSCARTGAHLQTECVTRKRKVVETGDKVVETRTIVVKRVRSKK
mmetsp:Transcript_88639/g.275565  ORF Transcript_88639/g.275565 Transcript_88639/m.275565 type:complete len:273 (-) Transcript_88639:42-860(-)